MEPEYTPLIGPKLSTDHTTMYLQVYQRLQKIGLCMSHFSTIKLVDSLGEDFDMTVKEWKQVAENKMVARQVHYICI